MAVGEVTHIGAIGDMRRMLWDNLGNGPVRSRGIYLHHSRKFDGIWSKSSAGPGSGPFYMGPFRVDLNGLSSRHKERI